MELVIGQKTYYMLPTFESIMAFEERAGISVMGVMRKISMEQELSSKAIVSAVWSGVLGYYSERGEEEKAPTFNAIGRECVKAGFSTILEDVTKYILSMMASDDDREKLIQKAEDTEKK